MPVEDKRQFIISNWNLLDQEDIDLLSLIGFEKKKEPCGNGSNKEFLQTYGKE